MFGAHGVTSEGAQDLGDAGGAKLSDASYKEAFHGVKDMKPGDVLFIEGYGHSNEVMDPIDPKTDLLGRLALLACIKAERELKSIQAFQFALNIASLNGALVVSADLPASHPKALPLKKAYQLITQPQDADEVAQAKRLTQLREEAARNTLIRWALDHPILPLDDGKKPELRLLFGAKHREGIEAAFKQTGLEVASINLAEEYLKTLSGEELIEHVSNKSRELDHWVS